MQIGAPEDLQYSAEYNLQRVFTMIDTINHLVNENKMLHLLLRDKEIRLNENMCPGCRLSAGAPSLSPANRAQQVGIYRGDDPGDRLAPRVLGRDRSRSRSRSRERELREFRDFREAPITDQRSSANKIHLHIQTNVNHMLRPTHTYTKKSLMREESDEEDDFLHDMGGFTKMENPNLLRVIKKEANLQKTKNLTEAEITSWMNELLPKSLLPANEVAAARETFNRIEKILMEPNESYRANVNLYISKNKRKWNTGNTNQPLRDQLVQRITKFIREAYPWRFHSDKRISSAEILTKDLEILYMLFNKWDDIIIKKGAWQLSRTLGLVLLIDVQLGMALKDFTKFFASDEASAGSQPSPEKVYFADGEAIRAKLFLARDQKFIRTLVRRLSVNEISNDCLLSGWCIPDYAWSVRFRPIGKPNIRDQYIRTKEELGRLQKKWLHDEINRFTEILPEERSLHEKPSQCFFLKWR